MIRNGGAKAIALAAASILGLGCVVGVLAPAGLGWDFSNFYDAGRRVAAGQVQDIYHSDRPIAGQPTKGMRFWGAPLSAPLFAPLAPWKPTTALVLFKIENVLALGVALTILHRVYRRFTRHDGEDDGWWTAAFLVMCVLFQPFWTVFRVGGQSTPTVLALIVISLLFFMRSRMWITALLLMIAAIIKPTLALMLAFLVVVAGWPFFAALVTMAAVFGVVSLLIFGWPLHREFIDVAIEGSQFARPWPYNSSIYVPLENLRLIAFNGEGAAGWATLMLGLTTVIKVAIVGLLVIVVRQSRRQEWSVPARRHFELMMAICFWLFVSQTVWEHYLEVLFPLLAYIVAVGRRFPPEARRLVAAIFILALGQNIVLVQFVQSLADFRSIGALLAVGLVKSGPLLLTLVALWRYRRVLFESYTSPAWSAMEARP